MGTARDIALIFLSIEALVMALIPLAIVSALAYGIYRLQKAAKVYLQLAQGYAQMAHNTVVDVSHKVAQPVIRVHAAYAAVAAVVTKLLRRDLTHG